MGAKVRRKCQECKQGGGPGDWVCYSKDDNRYLHGGCRGPGEPYSHGKAKENRDWWGPGGRLPR